ncbi:MAG: thioredoxin family protein [Sulfurospirillum sp.]|nr:thioredoxin family protein [Sulfurospirillum sp.]
MKLEVLGTGCAKCKTLEKVAKDAVAKFGGFHEVKKVDDIMEIMNYGVMSTPTLVIDGKVVSSGKSLSIDDVLELMKSNNS